MGVVVLGIVLARAAVVNEEVRVDGTFSAMRSGRGLDDEPRLNPGVYTSLREWPGSDLVGPASGPAPFRSQSRIAGIPPRCTPHASSGEDYNHAMNFLQLGEYYLNLAQIRYVFDDTAADTVKVWFVGSDEPLHLTGRNGKAFLHHLGAKDAGTVNT